MLGCGHYVLTGQLIVTRGPAWICLECALDHIRQNRAKETRP
jgi:hypothetical protein